MLTLLGSKTSPDVRKVRLVIDLLDLNDQVVRQPANTQDPEDALRTINPLGKIPALLLEVGTAVFDSRVIIEYLETRFGDGRIIARDPMQRIRQLTLSALAEGVNDALILIVYEGRYREPEQVSQRWLDHQYGKVRRGLEAISRQPEQYAPPGIAALSLACALGYADWRQQLDWRGEFPALAGWLDEFAAVVPAWDRTRADTV
jgi:glutathione S-transferase